MKTVAQMWSKFEPLAVTLEEMSMLLNKRQRGQKLVWRTKGEVVHAVTACEWAYRLVAQSRGEDFPAPVKSLDFVELENRAMAWEGKPWSGNGINTGRLNIPGPEMQFVEEK